MATKIQLRHDSSNKWVEVNPILLPGEIGIELDTKKFKIGDGSTDWNNLQYAVSGSGGGSSVEVDGNTIILNTDGTISSNAVKDQNNIENVKFWTGTLAEYEALEEYDDNTLYNVTDDDESVEGLGQEIEELMAKFKPATIQEIGLVKPDGTTITIAEDGTISADIPEIDTSKLATKEELNAKQDAGDYALKSDIPEAYELPTASTDILGGVKVDGDTIKIVDGVISAESSGSGGDTWSYNKAGNGYIKHPSGILIQWGTLDIVAGDNGTTLTFPTPFSSTNYSISASANSSQKTTNGYTMWLGCCAISTKTKSTSSCSLVASSTGDEIASNSTSATAFWIAIGY